jgi:SNF2 family DNA or RNA helicase
MIISGEVAGHKRQERVDAFQAAADGFDLMILSPKAGGVGLTLTAANNVVHLTRWWNPAVEDQSTDRCYRIGQERPVNVYLPMALLPGGEEHSFDNRLHQLLSQKRALSRDLLMPAALSEEDARRLYEETIA